jgi:hypothetical protein
MDTADITAPVQAGTPEDHGSPYEQCEQCGAPVERTQRYCVVCGAHRRHVSDPSARYLAGATSKARIAAARTRAGGTAGKRTYGLGTAVVLAVIPLAVGVGLLLGRASNNGDGKLIAALRAQKPEIINTGGGTYAASSAGNSSGTSTSVSTLKSTFPLASGYAVELQTLSGKTAAAAVTSAERADAAKGATGVGLIVQSDFTVSPSPPSGAYVIYSGAYRSRGAAQKALAKLKHGFPKAVVIQAKAAASSAGTPSTQVLSSTSYGQAHQVVGFNPSASQLSQDKQIVDRIQQESNKSYVNSQRGLPDQISVP